MQICVRLRESVRVYANLCDFTQICVILGKSARDYAKLREIRQICAWLRKSARDYANLRDITRICTGLCESVRVYTNMLICAGLCECAQVYMNLREITWIWRPFYFLALKKWKLIINYHAKSRAYSLKIDWIMHNLVFGGHFAFWRPFCFLTRKVEGHYELPWKSGGHSFKIDWVIADFPR